MYLNLNGWTENPNEFTSKKIKMVTKIPNILTDFWSLPKLNLITARVSKIQLTDFWSR